MKKLTIAFVLMTSTLVACSQRPAEVHYNSDQCSHCRMMITDAHFASQLVTNKGKAYKFDAVECMLQFQTENPDLIQETAFWVSDYQHVGGWLNAKDAAYVQSEKIQSPMGAALLAFKDVSEAQAHIREVPGKILNWRELHQLDLHMNTDKPAHNMMMEHK